MRKPKYLSLIILIAVQLFFLTGCWNYREIDDLGIIAGMTVDKGSTQDSYLLTFEIVTFSDTGKEAKVEPMIVESEGKTIFDAVRNSIRISAKKLYWSHVNIVIVSQEIAEDGILQILDFINRDAEPREQMHIVISKEKTAKELLKQKSITTEIRAFDIEKMMTAKNSLGKAPEAKIHDIINMLGGEGISVTLPAVGAIENNGEKKPELSGAALFDKEKFIGFLDGDDTKYFLFVKNKIEGGLLTFKENPQSAFENVTLEIFNNKTRLTPIYYQGKITMGIDIQTKVSIAETDFSKNVIDQKGRDVLKAKAEDMLRNNIEQVVKKIQLEFGVDAFGFGSTIKKKKPELWKSIKGDWHNIYRNMEVSVNVEMDIKASGLISKPIKIGD